MTRPETFETETRKIHDETWNIRDRDSQNPWRDLKPSRPRLAKMGLSLETPWSLNVFCQGGCGKRSLGRCASHCESLQGRGRGLNAQPSNYHPRLWSCCGRICRTFSCLECSFQTNLLFDIDCLHRVLFLTYIVSSFAFMLSNCFFFFTLVLCSWGYC